jgi:hypothetical protein
MKSPRFVELLETLEPAIIPASSPTSAGALGSGEHFLENDGSQVKRFSLNPHY